MRETIQNTNGKQFHAVSLSGGKDSSAMLLLMIERDMPINNVIAYHLRQSFVPGEITPEDANRLGCELAKRFTKGNHAYIVCTHIDKAHIHNHVIWNSTALSQTRKFRNFWGSSRAVRRLNDTICIENGYSIVENPKRHGKSYNKWLGDKKKPSHRERICAAIDDALTQKPDSFETLLELLRQAGYEVKDKKVPSLLGGEQKKSIRMDTLGDGYTPADLRAVIAGEKAHTPRKSAAAPVKPEKRSGNLLVDIQAKLRAGKGAGYARWATLFILTNEKYKGDAILNKTYIRDCLSKKVMINNGERPKYYVENNHPAIIDSGTFGRVQEEMARRGGKRKVKQVGTKTEQGRYSSKYALTELLICGECGTPYRRCTWAANGKKKVVWRCINRLDYGKKYCHDSPSIEESVLQEAIMKAVLQTAKQNADVLKTLKLHIGMGLSAETTEDNSLDLQIRIAEVEAEFQKMLKAIAADNVEAFDEEKAKALMGEKAKLQIQLDRIADTKQKRENAKSRLDEIFTIIEALANHPISYDDQIVRQVLESVIVESKEKIKVVFVGGLEVTQLM